MGRFLSADTLIASFANPQSLNRFSYVYNNPVNKIDPTGHRTCDGQFGCEANPQQKTPNWRKPLKSSTDTNKSDGSNTPAEKATRAEHTGGGGVFIPLDPASFSPNNGLLIIASRDTEAFLRGEYGVGDSVAERVSYIQIYLTGDKGIVTGAETDVNILKVGGMGVTEVYGDDGDAVQVSTSTGGPIHLTAQVQGNAIQGGVEAEVESPLVSVRAAALAGLNVGVDGAEFITSQGYFTSVGGGPGFMDKHLPGGHIASIVYVLDTPARTLSTGYCHVGSTGYQTLLNMYNIGWQRQVHADAGGWTYPQVVP